MPPPREVPEGLKRLKSLKEVEMAYMLAVLKLCKGERGLAAEILKVDPKTLWKRVGPKWRRGERDGG